MLRNTVLERGKLNVTCISFLTLAWAYVMVLGLTGPKELRFIRKDPEVTKYPMQLQATIDLKNANGQDHLMKADAASVDKNQTGKKRCSNSKAFDAARKRLPGSDGFHRGGRDGTVCPDDAWMPVFRQLEPSKDFKFMNVGMNKGFGVAMLLNAWGSNPHIHFKSWHQALLNGLPMSSVLSSGGVPSHCGVCRDCISEPVTQALMQLEQKNQKVASRLHQLRQKHNSSRDHIITGDVSVLGIELNPITAEAVQRVVESLSISTQVQVVNAGVSDSRVDLHVDACSLGNEGCSAGKMNSHASTVPGWTVDDLVRNWTGNTHPIDYLEIDTEGHDPIVLKGAQHTLHSGLARMVRFEYHSIGAWKHHSLSSIISDFDREGYECYYAGQSRVWRLSGCLDTTFESRGTFGNIICVLRKDTFFDVLEVFEACQLDSSLCAGWSRGR